MRRAEDPRAVLFADETTAIPSRARHTAYGFYWTERNRGLGWGNGVTPTLKGGSKLGIASPPAVWRPGQKVGFAIARPSIRAGERLQGFRAGWTDVAGKEGVRWKLVGNAVSVPVATWLGSRLVAPGDMVEVAHQALGATGRWPSAAASIGGARELWNLSERPVMTRPPTTLASLLETYGAIPLSLGAARRFRNRA